MPSPGPLTDPQISSVGVRPSLATQAMARAAAAPGPLGAPAEGRSGRGRPRGRPPAAAQASGSGRATVGTAVAAGRATVGTALAAGALSLQLVAGPPALAAEGLLPTDGGRTAVLDFGQVLTPSEAGRLQAAIEGLETETGWKLRVLTRYSAAQDGVPDDAALRRYWAADKRTIVVLEDVSNPNILSFFYSGESVKPTLPFFFFSELQSRYGSTFFVRDNGTAEPVRRAVEAIDTCLRKGGCAVVPGLVSTCGRRAGSAED